jgi:hypothetical protein
MILSVQVHRSVRAALFDLPYDSQWEVRKKMCLLRANFILGAEKELNE